MKGESGQGDTGQTDSALAALPELPPNALAAAKAHRLARARFVQHANDTRTDRLLSRAARIYRPIESAAAACVVIAYLTWTLGTVARLLGG